MSKDQKLINPESWEQKEIQIRLERAEEFAKLSPQDQQKILDKEKIKFEEDQKKARETLGYQKFEPHAKDEALSKEEAKKKADELAKFEQTLKEDDGQPGATKLEKRDKLPDVDLKRFEEIFNAALENIRKHKGFEFTSLSLNNKGQQSKHEAFMTKLLDHSQENMDMTAENIWKRIQSKEASPWQIGLQVEIDMGEDKNNHLGLTNLSFELSLASLLDGHFTEKLTSYTNMVFFAAETHYRKGQAEAKKALPPAPDKDAQAKVDDTTTQLAEPFGLTSIATNGGLLPAAGAFQQGKSTAAAFSCNQGAVWGTFDTQKVPNNPKELQEAYDKLTSDK